VTGEVRERAIVLVNGGQGAEVPGTWSATLEWLVRRLAPELPELAFLEVRFRVKSWKRLGDCIEDCRAAIGLAASLGAREVVLVGFSMGGAVAIAAADHPAVTTVIGLAPWIPDRLDVSTLEGKRLAIVHGSLDRWLPGIPGVSPKSSLRGFERIRQLEIDASHTVVSGGLHGLALRRPGGGLLPLPRAGHWARLVAAELRRSAQPAASR
jgi:dienelactone hydrolase